MSDWKIKSITDIPRPMAWVKRESSRFLGHVGPYQVFNVPYLDRFGRKTGEQLYTWLTTLPRFIASFISTKVKRLNAFIGSTVDRKKRKRLYALSVRVATLAFISNSEYIVDRFIALLSRKGCNKILNAMIRRFVFKVG